MVAPNRQRRWRAGFAAGCCVVVAVLTTLPAHADPGAVAPLPMQLGVPLPAQPEGAGPPPPPGAPPLAGAPPPSSIARGVAAAATVDPSQIVGVPGGPPGMPGEPLGTSQPPPKISASGTTAETVSPGAAPAAPAPGTGLNPNVTFGGYPFYGQVPFFYTGMTPGTGVQIGATGGGLEDPYGRPAQVPKAESTPVPAQP